MTTEAEVPSEAPGTVDPLCRQLIEHLPAIPADSRLGVAYSGGVDSTCLLLAAALILGRERVVALLSVSETLAATERRQALEIAELIGCEVLEVTRSELANPSFAANGPDRCYHCKLDMVASWPVDFRAAHHIGAVVHGETADDVLEGNRPGHRAAVEQGVTAPLALAGVRKTEVREFLTRHRIPNADKPSSPCLASRIPFGTPVTIELLSRIDRAEQILRERGLAECRVRAHGSVARIEVPVDRLADLLEDDTRTDVLSRIMATGFTYVTLDLAGLRSGEFARQAAETTDRHS